MEAPEGIAGAVPEVHRFLEDVWLDTSSVASPCTNFAIHQLAPVGPKVRIPFGPEVALPTRTFPSQDQ